MSADPVTGRFAPSPTGPLHMGSLITALASYLDARQQGGRWLLRIDDLDPPRQDPNAVHAILSSLAAHGLEADAPVQFQSAHRHRYADALARLQPLLFYCTCTRRALAGKGPYPGKCRGRSQPREDAALRITVNAANAVIRYRDLLQGPMQADLRTTTGDFIVRRRDQLWAYNLATAVDDGMDFNRVLRGSDLLEVTAPQLYLMDLLELPRPTYLHIPLLCHADGSKLSKQTHAPPLQDRRAAQNLQAALTILGQQPPSQPRWQVSQWLRWGRQNWQLQRIPEVLVNAP